MLLLSSLDFRLVQWQAKVQWLINGNQNNNNIESFRFWFCVLFWPQKTIPLVFWWPTNTTMFLFSFHLIFLHKNLCLCSKRRERFARLLNFGPQNRIEFTRATNQPSCLCLSRRNLQYKFSIRTTQKSQSKFSIRIEFWSKHKIRDDQNQRVRKSDLILTLV